jgi:3-methyladenine DNA glycosylase AlkD
MKASDVIEALKAKGNSADAVFLQRFFKTAEGQYGAGDVFIGVRVPQTRSVCRTFKDLSLAEIQKLLDSDIHECRLAAVLLLVGQFGRANDMGKREIYDMYLRNVHAGRINNWDIVDASAEFIVGEYLKDKPRDILFELAQSKSVWERRVAVLATFQFIKRGDADTTLQIAELLLHDTHDLIQKAVGWMLREVGKRIDVEILTGFLDKHATEMPRTMLRYAIERLSPTIKQAYMAKAPR